MRDEFDDRLWNDHHEAFSEAIDRVVKSIMLALCKLNRLQFDAPWKKVQKDC